MKHILSLSLIFLFSLQLTGQPAECADVIAFIQDIPTNSTIASDKYPVGYCNISQVEGNAEGFIIPQFVLEDFVLDEYPDINTVCFPGTFCYFGGTFARNEDNSSYRTEICEPYNKTFQVTYYNDYPGIPVNLSDYIYAGPFNVTTTAQHINLTSYYQFTGIHDVVNFPLNTTFWVSIQNIDNDGCEFRMFVADLEGGDLDRTNIATRNIGGSFYVVPEFGSPYNLTGCINFALGATGLAPIPTLSQWGIIILGLLVIVFGVSYVRKEQLNITG